MTDGRARRQGVVTQSRRWALLLAAIVIGALGIAGSVGAAPQGPGVQVRTQNDSKFITAQDIATKQDVSAQQYTVRGPHGQTTVTRSGLSLPGLLQLATQKGLTGQVNYVTLTRANGSTLFLDPSETYAHGLQPVFSTDGASTRFLRPQKNSNDINAPDNFATPNGKALVVGARKGNILGVTAKVSDVTPAATKEVNFTASVKGNADGETINYTWTFGDGTTAKGKSVQHAFKDRGGYVAYVTAEGDKQSGGQSSGLEVTVGKPPPGDNNGSGPTNGNGGNGPNGNGHHQHGGGGGDNGGVGVGDTGTGTGSTPGYTDPGYIDPGYSNPGYGSPSYPTPSYNPPDTTPSTPSTPDQTSGPKLPNAPTGPQLDTVTGDLISNVVPITPGQEASAAAASIPSSPAVADLAKQTSDSNHSVPLTAIGVAALLLAGAAWEMFRARRTQL